MSLNRTIGILVHEAQPDIVNRSYIIWAMARVWASQGLQVRVIRGLDEAIETDLLFPHIDLTVVPERYQACIETHSCVINRHVRDISKTLISTQLVRRGDGYDGPVIVKTDQNSGGAPEARLSGETRLARLEATGWWRRTWERMVPEAATRRVDKALATARALRSTQYPIYPSVKDVPPAVFDNPHLVVERFLPERDGELYCVRSYVFFGDRGYNTLKKGPNPVVKGSTIVQREPVPIPDEIIEARRQLGFDYGKFDYVVSNDSPILLDVNHTPMLAGKMLSSGQLRRMANIAEGLSKWIRH